jgi:metal-responsive CopG/Arc/MetJ family transcriptional regulator
MENKKTETKMMLYMSKELLEKIDDFRFENRFYSRAEAVRELIRLGLKSNEGRKERKN